MAETIGKFFRFTVGKEVYFLGNGETFVVLRVPVKDEYNMFRLKPVSDTWHWDLYPHQFYALVDYQKTFKL